jgi:ABC-type antimicrobial peptide transport system permease subunit
MSFRIVPIVYRPIIQDAPRSMNLLIRTRMNAADIGTLVQREVNALDGRVPVHDLATMDEALSATFAQPRFRTQLLAVFAGLALLLAAVGVYGLLMRTVVQRYRDIGIRMALGADRRRVLVAVLRQGVTLAAIGIAIGIAASVYVTRFVTAMLYDVGTVDPRTLAMTSAVLVGATLVATYIPARAATRVDPLVALKHE